MSDPATHTKMDSKELFSRVNHLEQNQSAMQTDISTIKATLNRLVDLVSTSGKTNWTVIVAFLSFAVMVATPIFYNIKADLDRERSERLALLADFTAFRKETNDRLIRRAEFMGASKAMAEFDRQLIDENRQRLYEMHQNRFTDDDGEKLSQELEAKFKFMQELLIQEIKK